MSKLLLSMAVGACVLAYSAVPASAQMAPDGTTAEERAHTAALNQAQAEQAAAEIAAFKAQVAANATLESDAKTAYADKMAAYEAEKARIAAAAAEALVQWKADVAACNAGDYSRCAPVVPR